MSSLTVKQLTEDNFSDFEKLLCDSNEPGCYCSFWHSKWASVDKWKEQVNCAPQKNKITTLEKVRSGFHVGVLIYENSNCVAWVAVGPMTDFYWLWRRLAQTGEEKAKTTAGILCINIAPSYRGKGYQKKVLDAVTEYSKNMGWTDLEGYPFDDLAFEKHGLSLDWTGFASAYQQAGFERAGAHWLSAPEYSRSIYQKKLI